MKGVFCVGAGLPTNDPARRFRLNLRGGKPSEVSFNEAVYKTATNSLIDSQFGVKSQPFSRVREHVTNRDVYNPKTERGNAGSRNALTSPGSNHTTHFTA